MANFIPHRTVFNEKELLDDLLMSEKHISNTYNTGIFEVTCPNLRLILNKCLSSTYSCQFNLFNAMQQRGWWEIEEVDYKLVEKSKQKYMKMLDEID